MSNPNCTSCGKLLSGKQRQFCSVQCRKRWYRYLEAHPELKPTIDERHCVQCGTALAGAQTRFCSKQCANLSRSSTRVSDKTPRTNCALCGASLTGRQTQYCSVRCKFTHQDAQETQKRRRIERKRELVRLSGGRCSRCGYSRNLAALSFHHLDPARKSHPLDTGHLANRSWEDILAEFEKCTLLCLRCHAEEHSPHLFLADLDIDAHIEASRKRARGELDSMFQPVVIGNCMHCGRALESSKAKFCSTSCRARYQRRHILPSSIKDKYTHCVTCQQPLSGRQRKYCSDACRAKYEWVRIASVRPTVTPQEKSCVVCGAALTAGQQKYCSRACQNKHFQAYDAQQARGLKRKLEFVLAHGGQCVTCGYHANLAALAFHHTDAALKSFELDVRALANRTSAALEREVAKCVLLCHNCHAEHHHPTQFYAIANNP